MLCLQASIGALNDLVDAPLDAGQKPGKPLPRGLVSARSAVAGDDRRRRGGARALLAVRPCRPWRSPRRAAGLGYLYDLRLSRTPDLVAAACACPAAPADPRLARGDRHGTARARHARARGRAGGHRARPRERARRRRARRGHGPAGDRRRPRAGDGLARPRRRAWGRRAAGRARGATGGELDRRCSATLRSAGVPAGWRRHRPRRGRIARARSPRLRERGWELEAVGVAAVGIAWLAGTRGFRSACLSSFWKPRGALIRCPRTLVL